NQAPRAVPLLVWPDIDRLARERLCVEHTEAMLAGHGSCHVIGTDVAQAHKRLAQRDPCARLFTQARGQSGSAEDAGVHQHLPETYVRTTTIGGHGVTAPHPWPVAHRSRPRG